MTISLQHVRAITLAAAVAALTNISGAATAGSQSETIKLLTAKFEPRQVVQVEVGDFRFKPGQIAPIHTHSAPTVGYVAKGAIIYQVEGEKPKILRAGDAFYEPVGPRILRFDNASATEEAIFLDFNLEQHGEPFIVFEKPPTAAIDRRSLPTVTLDNETVSQVDVHASELPRAGQLTLNNAKPTLALVTEGVVEVRIKGQPVERIVAGGSFALQTARSQATIVNASSEVPAKLVTFLLR